jgi:N-hydroxyarylamine O-acetyltransferase
LDEWIMTESGLSPDAVSAVSVHLDRYFSRIGYDGPRVATLCAPLAFATQEPQPTPLEPARLAAEPNGMWKLAVLEDGAWADAYRFESTPAEWVDYEVSNWYTSTSPDSFFTDNLIACRVLENGRATLFNDRYSERDARGARTLTRTIAGADELMHCLRECFGIDASDFDAGALFARIAGRTPRD